MTNSAVQVVKRLSLYYEFQSFNTVKLEVRALPPLSWSSLPATVLPSTVRISRILLAPDKPSVWFFSICTLAADGKPNVLHTPS